RISGNMILPPMPGHRRPTSGEEKEAQQSAQQSDSLLAAKGISVLVVISPTFFKVSGNMTLPPITGHGKPILGEQKETKQSDFLSAVKDISVPEAHFPHSQRISGNIPRRALRLTEM